MDHLSAFGFAVFLLFVRPRERLQPHTLFGLGCLCTFERFRCVEGVCECDSRECCSDFVSFMSALELQVRLLFIIPSSLFAASNLRRRLDSFFCPRCRSLLMLDQAPAGGAKLLLILLLPKICLLPEICLLIVLLLLRLNLKLPPTSHDFPAALMPLSLSLRSAGLAQPLGRAGEGSACAMGFEPQGQDFPTSASLDLSPL